MNGMFIQGSGSDSEHDTTKADIERLYMITEALWNIVKHELGYTNEMLAQVVEKIDASDGHVDGRKRGGQNPDCPSCNRKMIGQHQVCLYCGHKMLRDVFER